MSKSNVIDLGPAEDLFRSWNDFEPGDMELIDIPEPKGKLIDLGPIYQWDYTSPKWHPEETTYYYHHFKKNPPHLFQDEDGNYFSNGNIKITPLGIDDWDYRQDINIPRYPSETVAHLGILELIKVQDPETNQIQILNFGDRYMSGDPQGDWVFISSPENVAVENPSIRQEIHNVLKSKGIPLDAFDKYHPDFPKVRSALKEAGIWGRVKETGMKSENPITLGDISLLTIIALAATTVFGHLIRKAIDRAWEQGEEREAENKSRSNPSLGNPNEKECYDILSKIKYNSWVNLYEDLIDSCEKKGFRITEDTIRKDVLRNIHSHYLEYVKARYHPIEISAKVIKEITSSKLREDRKRDLPFGDGNRRTSIMIASLILKPCGYNLRISDSHAKKFRNEVRNMTEEEVITLDRKSTRLNSSHIPLSRMPSSA